MSAQWAVVLLAIVADIVVSVGVMIGVYLRISTRLTRIEVTLKLRGLDRPFTDDRHRAGS